MALVVYPWLLICILFTPLFADDIMTCCCRFLCMFFSDLQAIPDLEVVDDANNEADITTQVAAAPHARARAVQSLSELDSDTMFALPSGQVRVCVCLFTCLGVRPMPNQSIKFPPSVLHECDGKHTHARSCTIVMVETYIHLFYVLRRRRMASTWRCCRRCCTRSRCCSSPTRRGTPKIWYSMRARWPGFGCLCGLRMSHL